MNKIEEIALAYGNKHQGTVDIEVFEAGANAVLREIEQLVSKLDRNPGYQYNDLYVRMKDKIRELKGE